MHDIAHLVTPFVNPQQLPEFFWMHLSKDIEHLSRVTGKGIEDSTIIVHLVLSEILTNTTPDSKLVDKMEVKLTFNNNPGGPGGEEGGGGGGGGAHTEITTLLQGCNKVVTRL